MGDLPDKEGELCLRGDTTFNFGGGQFGRFLIEPPGTPPIEQGASPAPVHIYISDDMAPNIDALDTEQDATINHQRIFKKPRKAIKGWVKLSGGGGDCHHYEYSYHSNPYENGTGSSSPPYGSVPTEDTSSSGQTTPNSSGPDPNGYPLGPNEMPPSASTGAPTQQVQYGSNPAASPAMTQRFNVFPFRPNSINPVGMKTMTKMKGFSNITVSLYLRPEAAIAGGQSIEMNVTVCPLVNDAAPAACYRRAFALDSTWPTTWSRRDLTFYGFDPNQEYPITIIIERRNDVASYNTEVQVMRTSFINAS